MLSFEDNFIKHLRLGCGLLFDVKVKGKEKISNGTTSF